MSDEMYEDVLKSAFAKLDAEWSGSRRSSTRFRAEAAKACTSLALGKDRGETFLAFDFHIADDKGEDSAVCHSSVRLSLKLSAFVRRRIIECRWAKLCRRKFFLSS